MTDPSGVKVNYNLRPAKSIQRKMFVEALQCLRSLGAIYEYQYIGFGSFYFNDFTLFHKLLGLKEMISIERDEENKDRYEFNKPYNCIEIKWGESIDELPNLDWDSKTIIWLDYDQALNKSILSDINTVLINSVPGSVLIISVDVKPLSFDENIFPLANEAHKKRFDDLAGNVGKENIPLNVTGKDLREWGLSKVCKEIISRKINETVQARNGTLLEERKLEFRQLFHYLYKDSCEMLTFGGILIEESQGNLFNSCGFDKLDHIRFDGQEPYTIEVPMLTFKEIRHLNSQLPLMGKKKLKGKAIPNNDLDRYEEIYRYFPAFIEGEI